jgi:hypothetical protein
MSLSPLFSWLIAVAAVLLLSVFIVPRVRRRVVVNQPL